MSDAPPHRPGLDRFRTLEGEGGVPLDARAPLAVAAEGELPFRRCARCGMDAHRTARSCEMCGADLRTPEQERFNRELQASRKESAAAFDREAAELRRNQAEAAGDQRRLRVGAVGALTRPPGAPAPLEDDALRDLLGPGGTRRAAGRLAFSLAFGGLRAVPAAVWMGLAGLLLVSVVTAKATGHFGPRQVVWTVVLLVPIVVGILVGRPLRRADHGSPRGVPPGDRAS